MSSILNERDDDSAKKRRRGLILGCSFGGIVILVVLWAIFNLFAWSHSVFVAVFYTKPAFWLATALLVVGFGRYALKHYDRDSVYRKLKVSWKFWVSLAFGIVAWFLFLWIGGGQYGVDLSNQPYTSISSIPHTTEIRYLPLAVAKHSAQSSYTDPRSTLSNFQPYPSGNDIKWVAPMQPDGFGNSVSLPVQGLETVNNDGTLTPIKQQLAIGEGKFLWQGITWQVFIRHFFAEATTPYYVVYQGQIYTIEDYLGYHWNFPWLDRTEYWEGTLVIAPDGSIDDLTPDQAAQDPRLVGQRLFPEELAQRIGDNWKYHDGLWNEIFVHANQTDVEQLPEDDNQMPYLLPLNISGGPYWVTAVTPYGDDTHGLYRLFLWDRTGHMSIYSVSGNLLGPNQTPDFVKRALGTLDWSQNTAYEPRPIFLFGNKVDWELTVAGNGGAGITQNGNVIVESDSKCVLVFASKADLDSFVSTGRYSGSKICPTGTQSSGGQQQPGGNNTDLSKLSPAQLLQRLQNDLKDADAIRQELERRNKGGK